MDPLVLAFVALQGVLLAVVAAQSIARGRVLERISALVQPDSGRPTSDDLAGLVRELRERADVLAWELEQERHDAAYLADLIGVGIVHVDDELRVDRANAAAHVFLERPLGALVNRTAMEGFVDRRIEAIVMRARDRGAETGEVALDEPDGPVLIIRARRSPIRGLWLVIEDVAELRRLQRIRAEFIDNLSHELRTPLSALALLAETLVRDAEAGGQALPPRIRERIGKIQVETDHLTQMVTELLDLSLIERGGRQLHLDDVDVGQIAETAVERLRPFAERHGVELALEVPDISLLVRGDRDRIGQVFVNLIHNAVKFSRAGSRVNVRLRPIDQEVIAEVADRGVGISAADLPRVFERFYKADRARARGGGTGLGLAIARHAVESHGGRIWVESEEGVGSTFAFALPISPPLPPRPPGAMAAGQERPADRVP